MTDSLFFTIDQGTQSTRAMLFDAQGTLVAKEQLVIEPYKQGGAGEAEQEADYFWHCIAHVSQQLWKDRAHLKEKVAGLSIAVQRASVVCLDKQKKPLRPAVIWLDQRRAQQLPPMPSWFLLGAKISGQLSTLRQFQSKAECNWIAEQEPHVWEQTAHYVLLSGYLTYRLTGRLCDSVASQVGYLPFDYKQQRWANSNHWLWQALRVAPHQVPELIQPGERIGGLTPAAAKALDLPEGLPVYAAGADKACEVLGAGAIAPHIANISYGTTATLNTCHTRYLAPQPLVPAYPAVIANSYNAEVAVQRGYWMINWFKQEFAHKEMQQAEQLEMPVETLFERFLEGTPAGSKGLILQPFWNPGVRFPGPEAKGAIIGFGDAHTKAYLYRAIIEGIAYALLAGTQTLEKRQKQSITELRITGGGSQSDAIMQITADIFGIPAVRIHTSEATGLGAAMSLAVSTGLYTNHQQANDAMCHTTACFEPNPENHQLYKKLFTQVYQEMYPRLGPLYQRIKQITGYPQY